MAAEISDALDDDVPYFVKHKFSDFYRSLPGLWAVSVGNVTLCMTGALLVAHLATPATTPATTPSGSEASVLVMATMLTFGLFVSHFIVYLAAKCVLRVWAIDASSHPSLPTYLPVQSAKQEMSTRTQLAQIASFINPFLVVDLVASLVVLGLTTSGSGRNQHVFFLQHRHDLLVHLALFMGTTHLAASWEHREALYARPSFVYTFVFAGLYFGVAQYFAYVSFAHLISKLCFIVFGQACLQYIQRLTDHYSKWIYNAPAAAAAAAAPSCQTRMLSAIASISTMMLYNAAIYLGLSAGLFGLCHLHQAWPPSASMTRLPMFTLVVPWAWMLATACFLGFAGLIQDASIQTGVFVLAAYSAHLVSGAAPESTSTALSLLARLAFACALRALLAAADQIYDPLILSSVLEAQGIGHKQTFQELDFHARLFGLVYRVRYVCLRVLVWTCRGILAGISFLICPAGHLCYCAETPVYRIEGSQLGLAMRTAQRTAEGTAEGTAQGTAVGAGGYVTSNVGHFLVDNVFDHVVIGSHTINMFKAFKQNATKGLVMNLDIEFAPVILDAHILADLTRRPKARHAHTPACVENCSISDVFPSYYENPRYTRNGTHLNYTVWVSKDAARSWYHTNDAHKAIVALYHNKGLRTFGAAFCNATVDPAPS